MLKHEKVLQEIGLRVAKALREDNYNKVRALCAWALRVAVAADDAKGQSGVHLMLARVAYLEGEPRLQRSCLEDALRCWETPKIYNDIGLLTLAIVRNEMHHRKPAALTEARYAIKMFTQGLDILSKAEDGERDVALEAALQAGLRKAHTLAAKCAHRV